MKKLFLIFVVVSPRFTSFAQVNVLDASTIPATLKENAHSVKREEKIDFEVKDIDAARLSVHQVYTVLDAEGNDALDFFEYSTAFRKLEDAEIKVYDAHGKFINKYKLKEMQAEAFDQALVEDGKYYRFRVTAPAYPITVQYDYEVKYKGTLMYPDFDIAEPDQSVESSIYTATVPADIDLRYLSRNINLTPAISTQGKNKIYRWSVTNLPATEDEEGTAQDNSICPQVLIAPNKFSMDDNNGDLTSWKSFGLWYGSLARNANNLSDDTKKRLQTMVSGASNDKEKMKIIYNYLQRNFRYVSIQLGIGGFKPFDAAFVDQKKYGDCKALSNYMQACLSAVGITSYQALIRAEYNSEPVDPAFPKNWFDHVILCVPSNKDTTWLECTSNTTDFGVLGNFTENKKALLITNDGGVLVSTPKSTASENKFNSTTKIVLNDDASGESETDIKTTGEYKQELMHFVMNENKDDQQKYLVSRLGFLQPDELVFTKDLKNDSSEMAFKLAVEKVPEFTAGSKMFLSPRIYKIWSSRIPGDDKRKYDFYFPCPFIKTDTTIYQLPEDYTVENLPRPRDEKFEYGFYKTNYSYNESNNTITTIASLQLNQNVIPAEKYQDIRKFFGGVIEEYTEKIVIRKK